MTLNQLKKKYSKYIESIEKSNEYIGDKDYWCYLAEPYETDYGTTTIHDSLDIIEIELRDIDKRHNIK
ncbi:MAG: hypothetical protein IJF92_00030 [Bacilli bacterium]|nr:hypothetical protein [Bacilli bacterium]MBQ3307623.1 hypothetical protein [Bacilli bacterium]